MLPAIGSVSTLSSQGRVGVVVSARPISEPENGRQLVALRIREGEQTQRERSQKATELDPAQVNGIAAPGPPESGKTRPPPSAAVLPNQLSPAEKAAVTRLQQRDQQVKQEEKAHAAVAGDLAGPINYIYQLGPDGRQYAVGGSVGIQASALSGDPADVKRQAGRIAAAANAATNPSAQDYAAARQAYAFGDQLKGSTVTDEHQPKVSLLL